MFYFSHKYRPKFILYILSFTIILSCVRKHKFDKDTKQISEGKMAAVLADIFLMEAYVTERMQPVQQDSQTIVKQSFYSSIFKHHKVDSTGFYSTLSYYQAHPKEFSVLLNLVDSNLYNIKALDSVPYVTPVADVPQHIDKLHSFKEQEQAMQKEYVKNHPSLQKLKLKKEGKKKEN